MRVDGHVVAAIGAGLLVLVGIEVGDDVHDAEAVADKVVDVRIFSDEHGRMNRSVVEVEGSVLVVSQFTLAADVRRGRRPSFTAAADPVVAEPMVGAFADRLRARGVPTEMGVFGAMMEVALVNAGPVTIVIDASDGSIS